MMSLDFELIGRQVKAYRKLRKITQAELAERIEKSESYLSHIENARKHVSLKTLARISHELDTTLDEILYGNKVNRSGEPHSRELHFDLWHLLSDCTFYERSVIVDLVAATKASIRNNAR